MSHISEYVSYWETNADTASVGLGGLSLSIEGASKADIECSDSTDGVCSVTYHPTAPGIYVINILFADQPVRGMLSLSVSLSQPLCVCLSVCLLTVVYLCDSWRNTHLGTVALLLMLMLMLLLMMMMMMVVVVVVVVMMVLGLVLKVVMVFCVQEVRSWWRFLVRWLLTIQSQSLMRDGCMWMNCHMSDMTVSSLSNCQVGHPICPLNLISLFVTFSDILYTRNDYTHTRTCAVHYERRRCWNVADNSRQYWSCRFKVRKD